MIKNFLVLLVTVILLFVLLELGFRIFKPQIFEIHPRGMYISDPHTGYSLNPGFTGYIERDEFRQPLRVNKHGMRGRVFSDKSDNKYRILILGDSYAFGFGVTENETFASILEECSPASHGKTEVINGAVPGYGTIDELNFLKTHGKDINPDLVILQFLPVNDFMENRSPAVKWAEINQGMLTMKEGSYEEDTTTAFMSRTLGWLKQNLHSAKFVSERMGYLAMKFGLMKNMSAFWGEDFSREDEMITGKAIAEIAEYSKSIGADFLLLYTVGQGHVLAETQDELTSERFITQFARNNNIRLINTLREMRKSGDKNNYYYPVDGHWTAAGHRAVAEFICGQKSVLSWQSSVHSQERKRTEEGGRKEGKAF